MKLPPSIIKFLSSKLALNIITAIAFLNVFGYMMMGHLNIVLYFIAFAVLIRYFSKNMILILGVPTILINIIAYHRMYFVEGFDKNSDNDTNSNSTSNNTSNSSNSTNKKRAYMEAENKGDSSAVKTPPQNKRTSAENAASSLSEETFEVGKKGSQIDYSTTIEDAYDQLNSILGSDGIKRLTDDTQHLMKQQMQLAESMKSMTPLIKGIMPMAKQAQEMMKSMGDGNSGLGGVMELAKKLSGGGSQ